MKPLINLTLTPMLTFMVLVGACTANPVDAACCYFAAKDKDINQPGQKAFITWNPAQKLEAFTVQPKFEGNAVDFGMVIPTPSRPKLDEMPRDFFKDLAIYTILMPLPEPIYTPLDPPLPYPCAAMGMGGGAFPESAMPKANNGVRVLESGVVGSLDYKIIVAEDASGLFQWLKTNRYSYAGDEGTLQFYIKKKWFFTVMKIDPKQMKKAADGSYVGEVTPTRFSFSSDQCIYPLKITQLSVKDQTDALFYVQSPEQMDLQGDWSWMHSYRPMYLTYMLGCAVNPQQQQELDRRNKWLDSKRAQNADFETTKLEWAKKLGLPELSVLENPEKNYGQMGIGDLPPGSKVITLDQLINEVRTGYIAKYKKMTRDIQQQLNSMADQYLPSKGIIVKNDPKSKNSSFISTTYSWYPNREAPISEVKGLTRLKGHLQTDKWLTKFRKNIRKQEMNQDIVLTQVPGNNAQTYTRIMPTSPP